MSNLIFGTFSAGNVWDLQIHNEHVTCHAHKYAMKSLGVKVKVLIYEQQLEMMML